jgi:hypothetical protein
MFLDIHYRHGCAEPGQTQAGGPAYTAAAAGDDGCLAGERRLLFKVHQRLFLETSAKSLFCHPERSEGSRILAPRISNLHRIIGTAWKSWAAKNEILRSLRSLRMTGLKTFAEVSSSRFQEVRYNRKLLVFH